MEDGKPTINYNVEFDDKSKYNREKKKLKIRDEPDTIYTRKDGSYIDLNDDFNYLLDDLNLKGKGKIQCQFSYKAVKPTSGKEQMLYFNTDFFVYNEKYKLLEQFEQHLEKYQGPYYDFVKEGVTKLQFKVVETDVVLHSGNYIDLTNDLKPKKKSILNIRNIIHNCFLNCYLKR